MGQVAEAMVNGDLCEQCGVWLGAGDGFPRVCRNCWSGAETHQRMKYLYRHQGCDGQCCRVLEARS